MSLQGDLELAHLGQYVEIKLMVLIIKVWQIQWRNFSIWATSWLFNVCSGCRPRSSQYLEVAKWKVSRVTRQI